MDLTVHSHVCYYFKISPTSNRMGSVYAGVAWTFGFVFEKTQRPSKNKTHRCRVCVDRASLQTYQGCHFPLIQNMLKNTIQYILFSFQVKLTVQSEVIGGTIIQQVFVVDYTVENLMCDACHRTEAQDFWRAIVQVRQKSENKKTFYYLEQLILKHRAHENTLGIKPSSGNCSIHFQYFFCNLSDATLWISFSEGLDFFYATENHARKMVDFLSSVLPVKYQHSKKLLSHDIFSNIYNYKFTYCVDIVPLSRESIVCLPKKMTQQLGSISSLCLVNRVTNAIHLIDPSSGQSKLR